MKSQIFLRLFFLVLFLTLSPMVSGAETGLKVSDAVSLEGVNPDQIDSVLARLSDEQVRSLLIAGLGKELKTETSNSPGKSGGLIKKATAWLHLMDRNTTRTKQTAGFFSVFRKIPHDFMVIAKKIGNGSLRGFFITLALISIIFGAAWISEFFVRRLTKTFRQQFKEKAIPDLDGAMRLIAGMMRSLPAFIHILVFSVTAVILFYILPIDKLAPQRYLFLATLFSIISYRFFTEFSHIFCSPGSPSLRIMPLDDTAAETMHNTFILLCSYTFIVIMFLALFRELNLNDTTLAITSMALAGLLIFVIIAMILRGRKYVRDRILKRSELYNTRNWIVEQFAALWHIPTILYFTFIWMIMVADKLSGVQRGNSAFLMSLLFLPLFILFNGLGQWVVRVSINTLRIYNPEDENSDDESVRENFIEAKKRERKLFITAGRIMSLAIFATLLVWILNLWNVHIPFATNITGAVFKSLIALAFGLTVWRFSSSYIEKKLEDSAPVEENTEDKDDDWGAAATQSRSYTLLPMLRKFIASTLLVMVTLVILSSIGVDIGPLLAGAGVVGLAVGFGAQKMVSDVFSGFFYLLDDAFRVGEYIQAGSVSGAVESITLRNVMLRHHRGMLQIVPHSDLGSITNFMRGGIIVKFNLEFPYDANVDKIRKVIKKVGQAMLQDEEFGKDFIQPVKSAGVRDITGSVMVIRVKFKAQPGTQFVIRREAYRRITEALAAKGIHYAHRKVIVELPEQDKQNLSEEQQKVIEAGAAAAIAQQEEDGKG
ncbi:MAG TPA: mechanosensitive ion channel family protein [Desulfocapsa sulfexigens]|nr:mechanosensitive ion channel family protein [Desulfocapsa sulfexigens]